MNLNNRQIQIKNNFLYFSLTLFLYFSLYFILSRQIKDLYQPFTGGLILISALLTDYYGMKKRFRIFFRFLLVGAAYLLIKEFVILFSSLVAPGHGYHLFVDKLPYLFNRDTLTALIFILFYFIFDALTVMRVNVVRYSIGTLSLIGLYFFTLKSDLPINKTIFGNYFNLSIFILLIIIAFILRHAVFHHNLSGRRFAKKDFLLIIPLILLIILLFFTYILPKHIDDKKGNSSGLLSQNLFQFDFSNLVELKDEIKLNNDRVLIMELQGVNDSITNRISKGWNRQIYLKRFSLEEYIGNGRFKTAESNTDPFGPPVYISGYYWEMTNPPVYKNRADIIQTLYLINIDPSALMGSDLITKVVPMTNWPDSPYKRIYKSFSTITDYTYNSLLYSSLTQDRHLQQESSERKKMLLNWGTEKKEGKIKALAESIADAYSQPLFKALALQQYLMNNYYYSLKPGIARDGNQLEYFLFESKKAYCTYFAFAMTLMLRSIGISSRVAVGFAPDMDNRTLNYYDIRSLDAHAWVEVYFDDYGWLTFDPTSANIAEGEKYEFDFGNKEERDDLIEQIIKNKDKLQEITKKKDKLDFITDFKENFNRSIRLFGLVFFIIILVVLIILLNIKKFVNTWLFLIAKKERDKTIYLYKSALSRLLDHQYPIHKQESLQEYAARLKQDGIIDLTELTGYYQMALFRELTQFPVTNSDLKRLAADIRLSFQKYPFKKKLRAFFNISCLWKKILPMVFLILLIHSPYLVADATDDLYKTMDQYLSAAKDSLQEGYFDKGIEILNQAEKKYPHQYEPNYEKGKLYYYHDLYESAVFELEKAREKGLISEDNYYYLSSAYGKIGEDKQALAVYEEAFTELYPSKDMYEKITWMYFKVHKIDDAIAKAKEGLEQYPNSYDLIMTLGTLYSTINNYTLSKKYYLDSIDYSYNDYDSKNFRAIAYYNLSLLEHSFLYYDNAVKYSLESINSKNRSSAHLELGYLYASSLELSRSFNEFIRASSLEPQTLFPEMSIIELSLYSGQLDQAIKLTKALYTKKDFSWMLYFGTSKDEYYGELARFFTLAYDFKAKQINFNDQMDFWSTLIRPVKKIYYRILSFINNFKYTNLYTRIGEEKIKGGSLLEGLNQLYDGYEQIWPAKAYKVLNLAEEIEVKQNPLKKRLYEIKSAIQKEKSSFFFSTEKKKNKILENIKILDPQWEKEIKAEALVEVIKACKGVERDFYTDELFALHPPFLPMNNLKIKMNIRFTDEKLFKLKGKYVIKQLGRRGIIYNPKARFTLELGVLSESLFIIKLYDHDQIYKTELIKIENNKTGFENLSLEIFNRIFIINLNTDSFDQDIPQDTLPDF